MQLITIDQARDHVKASGDDDELLTLYCNAAEAACARIANRQLYKSTADLTAAVASIPTKLAAAFATFDANIVTYTALTDTRAGVILTMAANRQLAATLDALDGIANGLALDAATTPTGAPAADDIIAAVLLTVGHYYRNRESVVTGTGAAAVEVPHAAESIMLNYRWMGPIA